MKIFHTADWHLGKILQGVSLLEDQAYVLNQFINEIKQEKPDVVIIAGDLYDRSIPPPDAIYLLNNVINEIVIHMNIPVIAITGNHDSPGRLSFGSEMMRQRGFYMISEIKKDAEPIVIHDEFGEVHFHPIPYTDPSNVRHVFDDENVKTFQDAMNKVVENISKTMSPSARHIFIGHAFVTPHGEAMDNTSDSERRLSIGGAEYVSADIFKSFNYVALGHLHQAHFVKDETIRYAGSILKYSASEANHNKGYYIVELGAAGVVNIEKRLLKPRYDLRVIEDTIDNILKMERSNDYIFIKLLDKNPIISPMEKVRSVFPNTLHIERHFDYVHHLDTSLTQDEKAALSDVALFREFYKEVRGFTCPTEAEQIFSEALEELMQTEKHL